MPAFRSLVTGYDMAGLVLAKLAGQCLLCDLPCATRSGLCRQCQRDLPWLDRACDRCGESLANMPALMQTCNRCLLSPPAFASCQGVFEYAAPVDRMIMAFKFQGRLDHGQCLAHLLADTAALTWQQRPPPQLIVPVPLHPRRQRQRGFNQAIIIARRLSHASGIAFAPGLLTRDRDGPAQSTLTSAADRVSNTAGAFSLEKKLDPGVRSVAIVDDVVTTMATVTAITKVLKKAAVRHVEIWCLARASR